MRLQHGLERSSARLADLESQVGQLSRRVRALERPSRLSKSSSVAERGLLLLALLICLSRIYSSWFVGARREEAKK